MRLLAVSTRSASARRNSIGGSVNVLASRSSELGSNTETTRYSQSAGTAKTTETILDLPSAKRVHAHEKENAVSTALIHDKPVGGTSEHDTDDITAALQLLNLKTTAPRAPTIRFQETVQVFEFKRCYGNAARCAKKPMGAPMKYSLGLDWTRTSDYTVPLNDKPRDKLGELAVKDRCRLLAAALGVETLAHELVQRQQNDKTTTKSKAQELDVNQVIEKLENFVSGAAASPP